MTEDNTNNSSENKANPSSSSAKADCRGQLFVSDNVLSDLIGHSVMSCYGVVGMINPTNADSIQNILPNRWLRKGIIISRTNDKLVVDLYVVVDRGTNFNAICENLKDRVIYVCEKYAS
ncbi:MAG: Asp23/Gls24 family envelope stress response protein, partial [Enterococcus sp.]|nr:Asp23/Gls24 family envelope stress response protein [Enterococcus sp.]